MCAYTDNSSFRCGSSHYLIQILAGFRMSCVLSPGHGAHCAIRLLLFHAYCVVNQQAKELSFAIVKKRCKVVVARATYFTSLKDVSFASENQRSKHCGHSRNRTCDPFLRRETLYPLSYVSLSGPAMQLTSPVSAAADKQKNLNLPSRATF